MMILDVALGIVLGAVMLVVGFYALAWISNHGETALLFGIPLSLLGYGVVTDSPACIGWSGLLLIGAILLNLWRRHKEEARARERIEREAHKWHNGRDPGVWGTHKNGG
jgi:membrane-bound ClpP family serine protease